MVAENYFRYGVDTFKCAPGVTTSSNLGASLRKDLKWFVFVPNLTTVHFPTCFCFAAPERRKNK